MKQLKVDVAIIGAGTAGMTAYYAALAHTQSVIVIESGSYGTTCARVGCMPSKLLIAAAEAAHAVEQSTLFGVEASGFSINGQAVMERVRAERDRFVGFVLESVASWPEAHRLRGPARFVAPHILHAGNNVEVNAERIVIATGSTPLIPQGWQNTLGSRLIVNDDVFDWHDLPGSVAVVGAGVIGLELSLALARLGVRVRLFGRHGKVGPLTDPALVHKARDIVAGVLPFSPNTDHLEVSRERDEVVVHFKEQDVVHSERFDYLLVTIGRKPMLADLDIERAGLVPGRHGVPAFDRHTGQVGASHIFIAGDATADLPVLHEAADAGRIAGDNAGRFPDIKIRPRRAPLMIVFSEPQIAIAGESHAGLIARQADFAAGEASFDNQGRSRIMGRNKGMIRVYGERQSGRFLGAEMIGPAAEHIGHLLAWAVQHGLTVQQMLDSPFYHPVVEEGVRTALRQLARNLNLGAVPVDRCLDCTA
jgi:dihydrolipoamide dehydrogenase